LYHFWWRISKLFCLKSCMISACTSVVNHKACINLFLLFIAIFWRKFCLTYRFIIMVTTYYKHLLKLSIELFMTI
jgi:hypothetical protein